MFDMFTIRSNRYIRAVIGEKRQKSAISSYSSPSATNLFATFIFANKPICAYHLVVGSAVEHIQQAVFLVELFHTDSGAELL